MSSPSAQIIIVEDEPLLARAMRRSLAADGYEVTIAASGAELRRHYRAVGADLVLLDLNLGGEDGMDIARDLVATTPVALIIVTGRAELGDRIEGLDAGADDYLIKPVAIDELRARVRAVLRRRGHPIERDELLRAGPLSIDIATRTVHSAADGRAVQLTEAEMAILAELIRHQGRVVGRAQLLHGQIWEPGDRTVDVHVGRIRRKLRDAGIHCLVIWSVRGHGYRLRVELPAD